MNQRIATRLRAGGRLACLGWAVLCAPWASAALNDTGIGQCSDGMFAVACDEAGVGDAAALPRQDARFGRDAAAAAGLLTKVGGGAAGFDFTPLDASGQEIALTGNPPLPSATPACVRDNVTGLIWEVKTAANWNQTYTYPDAINFMVNANMTWLCGRATGWEIPSRRQLLSILHLGAQLPTVDGDFFPRTASERYWSRNPDRANPGRNWVVNFSYGGSISPEPHGDARHLRLVNEGGTP